MVSVLGAGGSARAQGGSLSSTPGKAFVLLCPTASPWGCGDPGVLGGDAGEPTTEEARGGLGGGWGGGLSGCPLGLTRGATFAVSEEEELVELRGARA